jgi:hypothetical protein
MERKDKIQILSTILIIGFIFAIFYSYIYTNYFHYGFPYNTFLNTPQAAFSDLTDYMDFMKLLNPYADGSPFDYLDGWRKVLFPFGSLIFHLLNLISQTQAFLIYYFIFLIGWIIFIVNNFKQYNKLNNIRDVISITLLSYPFLYAIDRGNIEIYSFLMLAGFCFFYNNLNKYISLFGIICLSIVIAIKATPVIFLLLLIIEKKWKELFFVIFTVITLTIFSLLIFNENIGSNISNMINNQAQYTIHMIIKNDGWQYGSSLFGLFKIILAFYYKISEHTINYDFLNAVKNLIQINSIFLAISLGYLSWYLKFIKSAYWKKIALIVIVMILFTPASADYKLLNLFIPLALFINTSTKSYKYDLTYTLLFGILLIPKNYYIIPFLNNLMKNGGLSISVLLNPIIMIILSYLIIREDVDSQKKLSIEK